MSAYVFRFYNAYIISYAIKLSSSSSPSGICFAGALLSLAWCFCSALLAGGERTAAGAADYREY